MMQTSFPWSHREEVWFGWKQSPFHSLGTAAEGSGCSQAARGFRADEDIFFLAEFPVGNNHIFPNYFSLSPHNLCPQHWCRKMCLHIYYYPPNTHTSQRGPVLGSPGAILQLRDSPSWKLHRGSLLWPTGKRMVGYKGSFQKAQRTLWFCDGSTPGTLSLEGSHSCGLTT